jgi:hypothetical protein
MRAHTALRVAEPAPLRSLWLTVELDQRRVYVFTAPDGSVMVGPAVTWEADPFAWGDWDGQHVTWEECGSLGAADFAAIEADMYRAVLA